MKIFFNIFSILIGFTFFGGLLLIFSVAWIFWVYGQNLPDYNQLSKYEPPVVSRVYASNGALLEEFAKEKRLFVPIESIPDIIKEAILALRIERTFSKDHIFELYLNEIYLGLSSYGVAAASLNYFDKSLSEISLEEAAYLAALPKGPNNYHPTKKRKQAIIRRNWVLSQMYENGFITEDELNNTSEIELTVVDSSGVDAAYAPYPVEEIRKKLVKDYGHSTLYAGGLSIQSTIDPIIQALADKSLKIGIENLDRRQGWRGPLTKIFENETDQNALKRASLMMPSNYRTALIKNISPKKADILLSDGSEGYIPLQNAVWARRKISYESRGKAPTDLSKLINIED